MQPGHRITRLLTTILGSAVVGLLLLVVGWPLIVPLLIYAPAGLPENHRAPHVWGYVGEEARLRTPDGQDLHGWLLRSTSEDGRPCTVLFTHGNAGNVTSQAGFMRPFLQAGFDAFVFDYRGYGASSGRPSEDGLHVDAEAAFDYLRVDRGIDPHRILIVGHSLGSAVAIRLATRHAPAGVVLAAPFTSLPEAMNDHSPWLPVSLLRWTGERFDSRSTIRELDAPLLVVIGSDDRLVAERNARRLYAAAPQPRRWLTVPGGHNDVFSSGRFSRALADFADHALRCA